MQVKKNVIAAISAAMDAYLEEEQAALFAQQKRVAQIPSQPYSPWAMAGRATAMEMRRNWQMRLVR
jgi:hypothetical protein